MDVLSIANIILHTIEQIGSARSLIILDWGAGLGVTLAWALACPLSGPFTSLGGLEHPLLPSRRPRWGGVQQRQGADAEPGRARAESQDSSASVDRDPGTELAQLSGR